MKVSVIVACYNAERTIAETIDSIFAQTRPADEIVIADDCSTDATREVIARYPTVHLFTLETNSGPAAARNLAIRSTSGDIVAIIDADDLWYPEHLATMTALMDAFPQCGLAFSGNDRFGLVADSQTPTVPARQPISILQAILAGNQIHLLTVVVRRTDFEACGGFDTSMRYCEDYDLWLRFGLRTQGVYSGKQTAAYRTHHNQQNKNLAEMFAFTWRARLNVLDELRRTNFAEAEDVAEQLGHIWVAGLYTAWAVRSRECLDIMLALSSRFPEHRIAERRWRQRRMIWPVMLLMDRISKLLPTGIRNALRSRRGTQGDRGPSI